MTEDSDADVDDDNDHASIATSTEIDGIEKNNKVSSAILETEHPYVETM